MLQWMKNNAQAISNATKQAKILEVYKKQFTQQQINKQAVKNKHPHIPNPIATFMQYV